MVVICVITSVVCFFFFLTGNILSRGWYFTTPDSVTGMRGSCVFIPCRFTYTNSMPADLRVIWYLLQGNQYPPVYDERQNVISKYRGITSLTGSVGEQNCSLKINKLDEIHGQDRLYPWIDKNPITFYHMADHSFYDKTTQIIILDQAPEPQLSTSDTPRVEEETSVVCSVQHTCFSSPPLLTISGILGSDRTSDTSVSDGVWERRVERQWTPKEEDQSVKCTVRYQGGQTATNSTTIHVKSEVSGCSFVCGVVTYSVCLLYLLLTSTGSLGFQLKRSLPVTIPVLILLLIVTVAAVVIFKR
uniref:Immunoglobulin V-set domain-containing protein n=1 Tax=Takifugu rubripes TaxID=31033 RepID=A0A674P8Y4_TAKRU